jgi:hypothetical protein
MDVRSGNKAACLWNPLVGLILDRDGEESLESEKRTPHQERWLSLRAAEYLVFWKSSYLVDPASSHMLVSKIKPCMSKYKQICTVKLRMAH